MNDFLKSFLERRREENASASESEETADLLKSINSNIKLVAESTKGTAQLSKRRAVGSPDSRGSVDIQREAVYSKISKEQLAALVERSGEQLSQSKAVSKQLQTLNKAMSETIAGLMGESNKQLKSIAEYLKPDTTHSKRDAMAREATGNRKDPRSKKDAAEKKSSIVDDIGDFFDGDSRKDKRDRARQKRRDAIRDRRMGRKGGILSRGRRAIGSVGDSARDLGGRALDTGGSWWDKIKGKTSAGDVASAGTAQGGKGLKGLWKSMPKGAKLGGALSALMAAGTVYDIASSDDPNMDKSKEYAKAGGGALGGWAGAGAGAATGAALGSVVPGIGTAVGGLVGGVAGGLGGSELGSYIGDKGTDIVRAGSDEASKVGKSIKDAFTSSIIPAFGQVIGSFGKTVEDFGEGTKDFAVSAYKTVAQGASSAASYAGAQGDKLVQKVTGDKKATMGSVASKALEGFKAATGLGSTSAQFESGKAGTKAVGWDPTGGTSYGKYQISAKTGTSKEFLDFVKERGGNDDIHESLSKAGFDKDTGSTKGAAVDAWKKLASDQGSSERLSELEHKFIEQKKFMPAIAKAKEAGYNTDDKGVQDAVWSAAVQHGRVNKEIIGKAGGGADVSKMTPEEQIKALYARRSEYVASLSNVSQAAGKDRYDQEVKVALAKSAEGRKAAESSKPSATSTPDPATGRAIPKARNARAEDAQLVATRMNSEKAKAEEVPVTVAKASVSAPVVKEVRKESPAMVASDAPEEVKQVKVANAEQISPKIELGNTANGNGGGQANSANSVPSLDDLPLQITDMGLVLLQIGHV